MLRRIATLLAALIFSLSAHAQDHNFTTPGNAVVPGYVTMCLNSSGNAIPCTPAAPTSAAKTLAIYGDSFATNAGLSAAQLPCNQFCQTAISGNYYTWADIYSGYRVMHESIFAQSGTVTNCGVTGTTTAQI